MKLVQPGVLRLFGPPTGGQAVSPPWSQNWNVEDPLSAAAQRPSRWRVALAYAALAALAAILYVPYILRGGYISDDWGFLKNAQDFPTYWSCVRHYFPLQYHRPLVPFVISAETLLVGNHPWVYILTNLLLWFGFVTFLCLALVKRLGHYFTIIVAALAAVPVLASAAMFWSLAMTGGTISFFAWALSFCLVSRNMQRGRYSLWAYLPLIVCVTTYEVVLPLFVLTMLFPLLQGARPIRPLYGAAARPGTSCRRL